MKKINTDVCVIGAGSGGLSFAAGAVQMGAKVVLLEGGEMGGDCLNYGCVPSKALLAAASRAHLVGQSSMGVSASTPKVDYAAVMAHVRETIETIAPVDSQARFEGLGVHVIREYGEFISKTELRAGDTVISARRFVIATGSSPLVPPIPGLDNVPYFTNETLFENSEKPDHLIIVGGGPIGIEMAQAHIRLGCQVTVIEGAKALGQDDPEFAAIVLQTLRDEGVEIIENAMAASVSGKAGAVEVTLKDGQVVKGSHLLIAAGRSPNTKRLALDNAQIAYDKKGITVGDDLRTSNKKAYAIGDVAGRMSFTHVAGYHAATIIRSILFALPAKAKTSHIPWATYTSPELAQVGLSEAQAIEKHRDKLEVVHFEFAENDRAIASKQTKGRIKLMVVGGRPVGATIVGAQAGDLISLWSLAIANRMKLSAVASMIAPYPTLAEVNKRVAGAYFSPRLFENTMVKRIVRLVQKFIP